MPSTAGIRDAFYRKIGRCPLREARGKLPEKYTTLRTAFLGSIERGDISRRVSRGGGYIRGQNSWGSLWED